MDRAITRQVPMLGHFMVWVGSGFSVWAAMADVMPTLSMARYTALPVTTRGAIPADIVWEVDITEAITNGGIVHHVRLGKPANTHCCRHDICCAKSG